MALTSASWPQLSGRHSMIFRGLSDSDKAYLVDRAYHMRNVYYWAAESVFALNEDQMGFIAALAATGLLGDDGDPGTKAALKFKQALDYAFIWLADHPAGAPPA